MSFFVKRMWLIISAFNSQNEKIESIEEKKYVFYDCPNVSN